MSIVIVTGSAGLIGSETVRFFSAKGYRVVGVDNDMRKVFFGQEASTEWSRRELENQIPNYLHLDADIRDQDAMQALFSEYSSDIAAVVHTAAQPSHDWAARDPFTDFTVNANGTLVMLEMARQHAPNAAFIFTSTNKVYGDAPNFLPLEELETRYECAPSHPYHARGIDESMSLDQCTHSLFGASKAAADILTQEYGRYFGMNTVVFRGGCLTGSGHSGTQLHGFLAYLAKCALTGQPYTVFGYKAKQVRDNIHASDLVAAFWHYLRNPRPAEVYNIGGGRHANCSMLEAIALCEKLTGKPVNWTYSDTNRVGDHIWYVSDIGKFESHYPEWGQRYTIESTLDEIVGGLTRRIRA
jgi:CDP-paratose 2-epimerase